MGIAKSKRPENAPSITVNNVPGFIGDGSALTGITSSSLDPALLQKAVVTLTAANIIAMFTTPVSILPAPGTGKVIVVDAIFVQTKPGGTNFTGGGAVDLVYHGTATIPHTGTVTAAQIQSGTAKYVYLGPNTSGAIDLSAVANVGLDVTNATAVFAAGNGTVIVTVWYSVVTLG